MPKGIKGFQKGNKLGRINKGRKILWRDKISKTLKEKYKNPEFKRTHGFQPNHKQLNTGRTRFRKDIIPWNKDKTNVYSKETIEAIRKARLNQKIPTSMTKPEQKFMEICNKHNLPFSFVGNGSLWIGRLNPDFIGEKGTKTVVEIFGSYWHNPNQRNIREDYTEEGRIKAYAKHGYRCIIIWDYELKDEELVLAKLKDCGIHCTPMREK